MMPHDFAIGDVYLPPLLIAAFLGLLAALATARLLNRYRLSRFLYNPQLVFIAMVAIYAVLIGVFLIRI